MLFILFLVIAYLIGSISSAILACKLMGLPDPRDVGSGNPGATNVLRIAGKKLAIAVLIVDVLKGATPVLLAKVFGIPAHALGWIALMAFIGHLFPVFFNFRGGKGVATALGGILAISWLLGLALAGTWLVIAAITRYSSLGAIITAVLALVYGHWLLIPEQYLPLMFICVLLILRHHKNIRNLLAGTESKIGAKKEAKTP